MGVLQADWKASTTWEMNIYTQEYTYTSTHSSVDNLYIHTYVYIIHIYDYTHTHTIPCSWCLLSRITYWGPTLLSCEVLGIQRLCSQGVHSLLEKWDMEISNYKPGDLNMQKFMQPRGGICQPHIPRVISGLLYSHTHCLWSPASVSGWPATSAPGFRERERRILCQDMVMYILTWSIRGDKNMQN